MSKTFKHEFDLGFNWFKKFSKNYDVESSDGDTDIRLVYDGNKHIGTFYIKQGVFITDMELKDLKESNFKRVLDILREAEDINKKYKVFMSTKQSSRTHKYGGQELARICGGEWLDFGSDDGIPFHIIKGNNVGLLEKEKDVSYVQGPMK